MKQFIHKSLGIFMAAVVLMTTMSFTVDMHFCGKTLVDFSFTHQVASCGMEKLQNSSGCNNPGLTEKPCCTDRQVVKKGKQDLKITFDQLSFEQQVFVVSLTQSYKILFEFTESQETPFIDYAPPFIRHDVQVLHQTFLI